MPTIRLPGGLVLACVLTSAGLLAQAPVQFRPLPRLPFQTYTESAFKVATGDLNFDGLIDIVFANTTTSATGQDRIYLNDGRGGFTDVTATNLPANLDYSGCVALGDVDRDGDLDIFFGNTTTSRLLLNDATAKFTDVSATNLPLGGAFNRTVYGCAFVDLEFDGDLDLIVKDLVLLNDGTGKFTDVTATYAPATATPWGIVVGDVNGDAFPDVVLGVSGGIPQLWKNDLTGKFTNASANLPQVSVTVRGSFCLVDVDGDNDRDLFLPNYQGQNQLWLNNGQGVFTDATATNLPAGVFTPYGAAAGDVDGDGDVDIVTVNYAAAGTQSQIFINDGTGKFTDATSARFPAAPHKGVGIALADLDQDGDLDIVFGNWIEANEIWWNQHRQVYAASAPTLAANYDIEFWGMPGYAALPQPVGALLGAAPLVPKVLIPTLGWLAINPAIVVPLSVPTIPIPGGQSTLRIPVPSNPALVGGKLFWQAAILDAKFNYRFTNLFVDTVQ